MLSCLFFSCSWPMSLLCCSMLFFRRLWHPVMCSRSLSARRWLKRRNLNVIQRLPNVRINFPEIGDWHASNTWSCSYKVTGEFIDRAESYVNTHHYLQGRLTGKLNNNQVRQVKYSSQTIQLCKKITMNINSINGIFFTGIELSLFFALPMKFYSMQFTGYPTLPFELIF